MLGTKQSVLFEFPKISENFENEYFGNERGYEFHTAPKDHNRLIQKPPISVYVLNAF